MSVKEQIEKTNEFVNSVSEPISNVAVSALTSVLKAAENSKDEVIEKTEQKSWGEKYDEALEAQMKERSEVLNNRPISDKELNEMLTRQREVMEKIIADR